MCCLLHSCDPEAWPAVWYGIISWPMCGALGEHARGLPSYVCVPFSKPGTFDYRSSGIRCVPSCAVALANEHKHADGVWTGLWLLSSITT